MAWKWAQKLKKKHPNLLIFVMNLVNLQIILMIFLINYFMLLLKKKKKFILRGIKLEGFSEKVLEKKANKQKKKKRKIEKKGKIKKKRQRWKRRAPSLNFFQERCLKNKKINKKKSWGKRGRRKKEREEEREGERDNKEKIHAQNRM